MNWKEYTLRPIVLFVAAYTINGVLHELAHAVTAYILKVPFVLFHLYVDLDRAAGTPNQRAFIRAAGPVFSLGLGLICFFAYRKTRDTRAELWLLYLGWFGVATLFGNLMSTAFVGDFSGLAGIFGLPIPVRYGLSVMGAVLVSGLAFLVGRELRKWAPPDASRLKALIGVILVPVIFGTALALLIYLPMPFEFAVGRIAESSFWIFAAVGALLSRKQSASARIYRLNWIDVAVLLIAILAVRLMVWGISLPGS